MKDHVSNLWMRWALAVALSTAAFVACWACLQFVVGADAPVALGWSILPFSVVLALSGVWADSARRAGDEGHVLRDAGTTRARKFVLNAQGSQGVQIGDHNEQHNAFNSPPGLGDGGHGGDGGALPRD